MKFTAILVGEGQYVIDNEYDIQLCEVVFSHAAKRTFEEWQLTDMLERLADFAGSLIRDDC